MTDAWEKFKKAVQRESLVKAGDGVVVAVSGGPDSASLLHLFWRLKKTLPVNLHAVYLNHGLRKQAAVEEKKVGAIAGKYGVPFTAENIPVKEYAAAHKVSVETAGRILRYRALAGIARGLGFKNIATGHTANDNAETVLMWLIRGTGTEGLAGIPVVRRMEDGIRAVRPIIHVTRKEIMAYCRSQRLKFCKDASNYSFEYTRNRIRHQVIPMLEKYNPAVVEHISEMSGALAQENEYISSQVSRALKKTVTTGKTQIAIDLKRFFRYNKVIQSRLLKAVLPEKRSRNTIERLMAWMTSTLMQEFEFSRSWYVEKRKGKVIFRKLSA